MGKYKLTLCNIGIHDWEYSVDIETRWCRTCHIVQYWCHLHERWEYTTWED